MSTSQRHASPSGGDGWGGAAGDAQGDQRTSCVDQEPISALWPLPAGSEYSLPPASGRVSTLSTAGTGTGLLSSWGATVAI